MEEIEKRKERKGRIEESDREEGKTKREGQKIAIEKREKEIFMKLCLEELNELCCYFETNLLKPFKSLYKRVMQIDRQIDRQIDIWIDRRIENQIYRY